MPKKGTRARPKTWGGGRRSGRSSIASVRQNTFEGAWMNLGADRFMQMTPGNYMPGIGLRPEVDRPLRIL
ncbi:phosphotransferase-like protein [Peribacillus kribbensis]|uniref:phosphotransferase-like protein n=1 Tax=Peribacillus kribbensis TaxID=356658 RepID=UPI00047DFFF2|nr:hypothetical protein [Peribacillus kribbensis]